MGRSRAKQRRKNSSVFKVAGGKNKKAKTTRKIIATKLKQMNLKVREKVHRSDNSFTELRNQVSAGKPKPKKKTTMTNSVQPTQKSVDIDGAITGMKNLHS